MGSRQDESTTQQPGGVEDGDENLYPDLMGQFPILDAYTQLCFGFELPLDVDRDSVVSALQTGLDRLIKQIAWLGWQMGQKSGVRTAVPWPEDVARELLHVKYCDDTILPMAQLLAAGVPIGKLDGKVLTPWPALPQPHGLTGPVPVITLQANFVQGGLILNLSSHHTMMDGTANFQVLKLLATVLGGDEIPAADLQQANRDRTHLIDLIPRSEPLKDHSHLRRPPGYQFVFPASPPTWCYFKMPVTSLSKLAKTAHDPSRPVTEDDVLHAFYWQRLCAVRLARGISADMVSKISRAIDGRMALGIPASYMGAHVYTAITRLPLGQVASLTLPQTAQVLRREFSQANTAWAIRSFATFIAREPDRSVLMYNGTHNGNTDVGATSSLNTNQTLPPSWGPLLGPCRFFRRSIGAPIPGAFVVQSAEGGAIPIAVCLPQDDLEALKKDSLWGQYTRCIG
jgi:trichothecene 3-O-acetyltransferase